MKTTSEISSLLKHAIVAVMALCCFAFATRCPGDDSGSQNSVSQRSFQFTYQVKIRGLQAGDQVRGWIPEPVENGDQSVEVILRQLPGQSRQEKETDYGNSLSYFSLPADSVGELTASLTWKITRRVADPLRSTLPPAIVSDETRQRFMSANRLVPVDDKNVVDKTLRAIEIGDLPADPLRRGEILFDVVARHMKYDKSRPGYGNGDAVWACDNGFGNCTDFHSLFISLARWSNLPARFEIGFSVPPGPGEHKIAGYHCWAYFLAGGRWIPVDISDYDKTGGPRSEYFGKLSANRVAFTTGRDLVLAPPQAGPPLNFFIYPYVEVNGEPWPREQVVTTFVSNAL